MKESEYTDSSLWIFPLLGLNKSLFYYNKVENGKKVKGCLFVSTYLSLIGYVPREEGTVYILIDNAERPEKSKKLIKRLSKSINFCEYFIASTYLVFVFRVLEKFLEDFLLVLRGKYSSLSYQARNVILKENFYTGNQYHIILILDKAEALRILWEKELDAELDKDMEVWPIIEISKETLRLSNLKPRIKQKNDVVRGDIKSNKNKKK